MHHLHKLRLIILLLMVTAFIPMPIEASGPGQSSIEQLAGTVDVVNRGVQLMKSGTDNWLNITIESIVARGDRIRTDDSGVALVTWFEDGTTMEVGPNSELVIEEFSGNDDAFVIEASLIRGSLFSSVRRLLDPESRYQVLTPSVSATVRGTVFGVYVNDDLDSAVAVTVGTVGVAGYDNIDDTVNVQEGNFVAVSNDGDFADVVDIEDASDEYMVFLNALIDFDKRVAEAHDEEPTFVEAEPEQPVVEETTDVPPATNEQTNETTVVDDEADGPPDHANPGSGNRADQADANANNLDTDTNNLTDIQSDQTTGPPPHANNDGVKEDKVK